MQNLMKLFLLVTLTLVKPIESIEESIHVKFEESNVFY